MPGQGLIAKASQTDTGRAWYRVVQERRRGTEGIIARDILV